jgi:PKD repeat protein
MKLKALLTTLVISLALVVPASPGSQALSPQASDQPASLAPEALAQKTTVDPTADKPPPPAGEGVAVPEEIAGVPGVTADWWAAVQEQIRGDLYALTPEGAEGRPDAYRGYNPDHRFEFTFSAGGLSLAPSASPEMGPALDAGPAPAGASAWTWALHTTGLGYEGDVRPLSAVDQTASSGNRLEFRRPDLTEWYVNDERGLEQGFTLDAPPAGAGGVLVLEMALDTELGPIVTGGSDESSGQAIEFTLPEGNVVLLRYSDLYAYDAQGAPLPARMALSGCDPGAEPGNCQLQLLVETAGARYPLRIDPLLTVPDWAAIGESSWDEFGYSVGTAGDVNGDGFADLVVGAWGHDECDSGDDCGKAYVYHGSPDGLGATPAWSRYGDAGEQFGYSVSTAGDVNGDGYDDLIIGAPYNGDTDAGAVSVYLGSPGGLPGGRWVDWHDNGEGDGDNFGWSVASAGDLDGDGYDDVIVGAPHNDECDSGDDCGKVYVYYGSPAGLVQGDPPDWTKLGEVPYDEFGYAVGTAGNVNGEEDGHVYADLVVGAPGADCPTYINCGKAYVYYGQAGGLIQDEADWTDIGKNENDLLGFAVGTAGDVNGDDVGDLVVSAGGAFDDLGTWVTGLGQVRVYHGSQGGLIQDDPPDWTATGEAREDLFGFAAGTIGDVNGDGYDDLSVGEPYNDDNGLDAGKVHVYYGSDAGLGADPAWTAIGENSDDLYGWSVAAAGDVNGDDQADLVASAVRYAGHWGKTYVYHGTPLGLTPPFDWTAGGEGAGDKFGYAVATAGDVNGDDYSDLVVGAHAYDGGRGKVYVYHGSLTGLTGMPTWSAVGEQAGDAFGRSVGTAGDVNGDGYDDLVVGAPWNDGNGTNAGRAYVFHGGPAGLTTDPPRWTASGVYGHDNFGASVAAAGDVNCDGYADLVVGAVGYPQGQGNGQVYVYHGGPGETGLSPGPAAWTASGEHAADHFGYALGSAGDVNGDRCADLVAGAWGYDGNRGRAYVYHGSSLGLGSGPAFAASGESGGDYLGWAVGTAGDMNGDGYSDLAVGAWGYDDAGDSDAGRVDLYPGSSTGLTTTGAISLTGEIAGEHFGYALGTAGDVDGDGYSDLLVGAEGYKYGTGKAYVYNGTAAGLQGDAAWTATGRRGGDHFGAAVGTAGDVDGDGYSDLVAGAWGYDDPANTNAGRAYVYLGAAPGLGADPWTAVGDEEYTRLGVAVATAGDVNGDGYGDLAVGAAYADARGEAYVYLGSMAGLGGGGAWNGSGEEEGDRFGFALGAAGDVNGDGYADLVVGADGYDEHRGKTYVYYGGSTGLTTGSADWMAAGETITASFGYAVATAGDVNGDGYADLVVGAPGDDGGRGKVYVYHGSADGLSPGGTPDWTANGDDTMGWFGRAVATAGDVNGDGYADLVVGAPMYNGERGKAYVYHGSPTGLGAQPAWTATGENALDLFGNAAATAGDVNGDGYADLLVFAPVYDGWRGRVYIYHGSPHGLDVPFSTFSGGDEGETDTGAISSVGTAGDVDGDGFADLVIGASSAFALMGRVYIYRGSPQGLSPTFDPVATGEKEGDRFGHAVATAGDANGDGYADVVAGAWSYDDATNGHWTGKVYVYPGNDGGGRASLARQVRGDGSGEPVQPWGPAYTADSFGVTLHAVDPLGRGRARLQVEACPPGVPFGDAACLSRTSEPWIEVSSGGEVDLSLIVHGPPEGQLYRWRGRALYDSPLYPHGPWRRLLGQALEADVRITRLAADLSITKAMDPEEPLATEGPVTYTLTFSSTGPARGVIITDLLSSDILSTTVISSGVVITDTGHQPCCVWAVQDLEAGEGGTIFITGQAQAGRFVNTAVITGTSPDPNPANNSATVQTHIPGVWYVDQDASGAADGRSWANAYPDLQDALDQAGAGDQIWIAEGTYRPIASGPSSSSFHLVGGVALHGGFDGTETWLHERDPAAHPTVLSGDIGTLNNPHDNVYHVVTASSSVTESAILEGLIISGGNADGNGDDGLGGGLYNQGGSPRLVNVAFIGNAAGEGGGLYNDGGSPRLVNVAFSGNTAEGEGGGIYNLNSSPVLTNTTFSRNTAGLAGGAIHNEDSAPTLANSILWGNTPDEISNAISTTVSYSDIEGGCPMEADCDQVSDQDPQLWDPEGEDGLAGTLDDDLRLHTTFRPPLSPVIDGGDTSALPADPKDLDGDGDTGERLPLDLSGRWRLVGFTDITPTVDMGAYEATVVDVLAEGQALFEQGEAFRLENLQLLSSDTLADALKNYANFNDGEWYYAFCADYDRDRIDEDGYCPATGPGTDPTPRDNVRNTLLDAVDLYRVAVGWPTEVFTPVRGIEIPTWEAGSRGVLSATTEIANVHLVFGNEFLVDATDYRFSTAGIPYADQIIDQELDELGQAQRQFELIMELIFRAFNEWGVGTYCDSDQFEQFGVASSLLMSTLNEIAARYYMLRDSEAALAVYEQADQFLQMVALDQMAEASGEDYLQDGSWEMLNNLSQMRERAQAIAQGLDFFGFAPDYAPLQAYEQLLELTEGPAGSTGLLGTARDLEDQARDAQRTFDANASDMYTELDNLEVELDNQLFELCGESDDYTETCAGGLMEQNLDALDTASRRVGLAWQRAQNIAEQIRIESDRAGQVINVHLGLGQDISAYELAIGKLQAERTTTTAASSSEDEIHLGVDVTAEGYFELKGWKPSWGFKAAVTAKAGYQHAWSWIDTTQTVWDPTAEDIASYENLKALKQAEAQADIEGANSAAVIRNLLLQQSEALEEYEIAMAEFNQLAAEHNYLAQQRSRLLNKRDQAINRVASHNSHLLSPAYRIWRDSLTTQSLQAHGLAAQFAYLTARAAEYELLTPYPGLGDIFRARTSNDIRLFLDGLKVWVQALDRPGQLNRYPYTISLAQDLWGLTGQALDPDGTLSEEAVDQARYEAFQELLQGYVDGSRLEFTFGTALDQQRTEGQYLFSPNIWNNRIAGIGAPLAGSEGVAINIVTRQSGDVGDPEVVLIHGGSAGGAEAYRNAGGQIVYYDPGTAVPVGYVLPAALDPQNTTAVLRPGINGGGAIANSALLNLSVAASTWTFRIPAESRGNLDYEQIEDIEILLDTTGRALPGRDAAAVQDALRLEAGLPMEPVEMEWAATAPLPAVAGSPAVARSTQHVLAPSVPGEIGGSYFGSVMITSPITITIQVLNLDLWNELGTLTGEVTGTVTSPYTRGLGLVGSTDNVTFQLASEAFTTTVAGQVVTQVFTLTGYTEEGGDILRAVYSGTLTNLLPSPIQVQGSYNASRPGVVGSKRLVLRPGAWSVQPEASTAITATLYDETMAVIAETQTLTFTTDLGTVTPAVAQTVDGQVAVTFQAGTTLGQATVTATTGEITGSARIEISDLAPPTADFSATPLYGTSPLTVTYTDLSSGEPNAWLWDLGDGTRSEEQDPTHVYTVTGNYTVTLVASNALDTDTRTRASYIIVTEPITPVAAFSASPTSGVAPLAVTFTDESTNDPSAWAWDFGDGGSSTEQHPQYTYDSAGTFTVTLTVSNTAGVDSLTRQNYITVTEPVAPPVAAFSASPTSGLAPLSVTFTDESTNDPTDWAWDFGDGGSSSEQHPQYTYDNAGTFAVTLTVSNAAGSDTLTMPDYIVVQEGQAEHKVYLPLVLRNR